MSVQRRPKVGKDRNGRVRWVGRFRDHAGREHSRSFERERDAKAWVEEQRGALRRGDWVDPARGGDTVGALCDSWVLQAPSPGTGRIRGQLRRNLGDLADVPVGKVTIVMVRNWVGVLQNGRPWRGGVGLGRAAVKSMLSQFRAMLGQAVSDGMILRNPAVGVVVPRPSSGVTWGDVPSPEVVRLLVETATHGGRRKQGADGKLVWVTAQPDVGLAIQLMAATGMRPGEVCGLTWHQIDFDRGRISVVAQAGLRPGDPLRALKTGDSGRRVVAVDEVTLGMLKQHRAEHGGRERLFLSRAGQPMTAHLLSYSLMQLRKYLGLSGNVTPKSLRHFHASMLLREGVPIKTVQARLGHATAKMTLDTYAHFLPGDDERAADVVGALLAGAGNMRDARSGLRAV